jgi:hypothetical protein
MIYAINFMIGVLAGLLGGLLGIGGSAAIVPCMVEFLGTDQHQAHGTSMVAVVLIGTAGAVTYARHGSVDVTASAIVAVTAMLAAPLGARFATSLPAWKLKKSFGLLLVSISGLLVAKPYLPHLLSPGATMWVKAPVLLVCGLFTGFLAGMMGGGAGSITACVLVLFLGFNQHTAQGSALLAMIPAAITGALAHWRLNNVRGGTLASLLPGVLVGTFLGGSAAHFLNDTNLRLLFTAFLLLLGIRYLSSRAPSTLANDRDLTPGMDRRSSN